MNGIENIIQQLEEQCGAIDRALFALREIEGSVPAVKRRGRPPGKKGRGGARHMSAEARARIGEATRKRWAEKRVAEKEKTARKKRRLTAAGRKRLSDAMKARWASKNPPKAIKKTARKKPILGE